MSWRPPSVVRTRLLLPPQHQHLLLQCPPACHLLQHLHLQLLLPLLPFNPLPWLPLGLKQEGGAATRS